MTDGSLLDPAFVRELEQLRLELRRRVAGVRAGDHRSMRRGASVEFAEHREYAPGDDPRRVDWNAFARLGELVVRLYVAEEDVTVHLVLDASRSMDFGEPTKHHAARRLAAALGYLCLSGSERVSLSVSVGGSLRTSAPLRGRRKLGEFLASLDRVEPVGVARLDRAVDTLLARHGKSPGIAVVLSDLFDEGAGAEAAHRLATARHETTVVHVLASDELTPPVTGETSLFDSETGVGLDLVIDAQAVAQYRARLAGWIRDLRAGFKKRGVRYVQAFPGHRARDVLAEVLTGARPAKAATWSY